LRDACAYSVVLIFVAVALSQSPWIQANASRGVPVYSSAFADTYWADPWRDGPGWAELLARHWDGLAACRRLPILGPT